MDRLVIYTYIYIYVCYVNKPTFFLLFFVDKERTNMASPRSSNSWEVERRGGGGAGRLEGEEG